MPAPTKPSKTPTDKPGKPLPKRLSKIKAGTAKQIAKNLLQDKYGHKVSDQKLKDFMKQDKDLKKFVYKSEKSSLTKHQAKKFFDKVVGQARSSDQFKVSRMAKKMGIKDTADKTSDIQLNKVYKEASQTEIKSMPHDTGPTPEELAKQQRRETALKQIHKRERAEEIEREKRAEEKKDNDGAEEKQAPARTVPRAGNAAGITQASGGGAAASSSPTSTNANQRDDNAPSQELPVQLLIFPIENRSPNVPGFELSVQKIDSFIRQHIISSRFIPVLPEDVIWNTLENMRMDTLPPMDDMATLSTIAQKVRAGLFIIGSMGQMGHLTELHLTVHNTANNNAFQLAHLKEPLDDMFAFQNKLAWQIDASLREPDSGADTTTPSATDATELPI